PHPITTLPNHYLTQSPPHPITTSPNHYLTQSPPHPITTSPNHYLTQSLPHPITTSPNVLTEWSNLPKLIRLIAIKYCIFVIPEFLRR
ncbi:MAG: hypothetical protein OEY34_08170, partial [Cyclobacteriaceae bacterium]|nr:hypothetical protein [Cyclobacteriaceae bacterium]